MNPGDFFVFHAPLVGTDRGPAVVLDRESAMALIEAIEQWLDRPPVIELVECIVCHVYALEGSCKHE